MVSLSKSSTNDIDDVLKTDGVLLCRSRHTRHRHTPLLQVNTDTRHTLEERQSTVSTKALTRNRGGTGLTRDDGLVNLAPAEAFDGNSPAIVVGPRSRTHHRPFTCTCGLFEFDPLDTHTASRETVVSLGRVSAVVRRPPFTCNSGVSARSVGI